MNAVAGELKSIDISHQPEMLRIAEEVHASGRPRILRRASEDLVIVSPVGRRRTTPSRAKRLTKDDSIFNIVGLAASDEIEPTDVSSNKHKYLAEAYAEHRR